MPNATAGYGAYRKTDVETASQAKLIVMMFNGAIQRAEEAKRQLDKGRQDGVHNNLLRAQEIIGELRAALDMSVGDVARNLDRLYEYFQHLLITANIRKNSQPIDEAVALMTDMRDTWKEAFAKAGEEGSSLTTNVNQHGAALMNLQG